MNQIEFPKNFLWGASTSSYQVEGGIDNADWSEFKSAGQACDHYNLYQKDFDLLEELNLDAYRFSLEWSGVEPKPGEFKQKEIDHYKSMLEDLQKRGITTMVTLHHFTTPLWLDNIGNWANKKSVDYFTRYAERVFEQLNDLVDFWITINEPYIYAYNSYLKAKWPPQRESVIDFLKVTKNQISAHKRIYDIFNSKDSKVKVGLATNNQDIELHSNSILDKISAKFLDYTINKSFLNRVKNHLDFIGLNYYFHNKIKFPSQIKNDNEITTDLGWEVFPKGIYNVARQLDQYNLPIYVTENGLADSEDKLREEFIKKHLYWLHQAISDGSDIRGYFHWSLLDNFEWAESFEPRFGLVEVDYETQQRKIRDSARTYAEIAGNNFFKFRN